MENRNIENLPSPNEQQWELEKRIDRHNRYAKSRYPPINIEHMAYERERLGKGMTPDDRALRKQWLLDQRLAPHEHPHAPQALAENMPRNFFKRMFGYPMDATCNALRPMIVSHYVLHV